MDLIAEIKAKLAKYPSARYVETPTSIEVQPANESGYPVGLALAASGFVVYFGGWHEHFESKADALNCFATGLSADCRLCVVYHGSTRTKWTVETRKDGGLDTRQRNGAARFSVLALSTRHLSGEPIVAGTMTDGRAIAPK
jgi:hypothetical protein